MGYYLASVATALNLTYVGVTYRVEEAPYLGSEIMVGKRSVGNSAVLTLCLFDAGCGAAAMGRLGACDLLVANGADLIVMCGVGFKRGGLMTLGLNYSPGGKVRNLLFACRVLVVFFAGGAMIIGVLSCLGAGSGNLIYPFHGMLVL